MNVRSAVRWLLAPAVDDAPRAQAYAATALRVLMGLLWLYNVSWKRPPNFGQDAGNGLYKFTTYAVDYPVFGPYSWLVEHVVLPNFEVFGWAVLVAETTLAVLLLSGAFVRVAALIGVAQSVAIGLSVAFAPGEWPWAYWLMIGVHALLLFSSAGRYLAVDGVRAGVIGPRSLALPWGGLAAAAGLVGVVASVGDPLAARGEGLRSADLSISLGFYNVLGGVALVVAGVLLLAFARGGAGVLAKAAAGLCVLAGLSVEAQKGFSDPVLGGDATSAAFFLTVAVVAVSVAWPGPAPRRPTR